MRKPEFFCPEENSSRLNNPDRGYYTIFRYTAGDDVPDVSYISTESNSLLLLEINLCRFTEGRISDAALSAVRRLFSALRERGVQLIVRFLYDWDGKNLANEPNKVEIIIAHMQQVGGIVKDNADIIFVTQGLFIGNWGEMHTSRYTRGDYLKRLCAAYTDATDDSVTISVRKPAQWRCVTGFLSAEGARPVLDRSKNLPGLFNDGIMGSVSDMGTYAESSADRQREMEFQNYLCVVVPNGGEVVGDEIYSDPDRAVSVLADMHISYLNCEHDAVTLDKWKNSVIKEKGIWEDMSLYDYIDRHLGYRFVISYVKISRAVFGRSISVMLNLKNAGFAPIYTEVQAEIVFVCGEKEQIFPVECDVRELTGMKRKKELFIAADIKNDDISVGEHEIYFRLKSCKHNCIIQVANAGNNAHGCRIGGMVKV